MLGAVQAVRDRRRPTRGWVQRALCWLVRPLAVLCGLAGAPAWAADGQPAAVAVDADGQATAQYERAVNAFKFQEFDSAIAQLRGLIYPQPKLDLRRELRAREYLAAALWWTTHRDEALDEFTALLIKQPNLKLDPAIYPPKMIEDVELRRKRLLDTGVLSPQAVAQGEPTPPRPAAVVEPPPLALMFFPLGVGQFANRQTSKGWGFLIAEAVLAGTSAGMYLYNVERGQSGPRPVRDDAVQISAGAAFWLVAGWGIWDAYHHWRAQQVRVPAVVR